MTENRRTATRHAVDLACTLRDGDVREIRVVNLSVGGAGLAHRRMPMGHRVHVVFRVPVAEHVIDIGAVVRWSTDVEVGVQFDGLRPKDVWALTKYFESL